VSTSDSEIPENLCDPAFSAFTNDDLGVTIMELSQVVVVTIPWPNSTLLSPLRFMFAANVDPKTDAPSKTAAPLTTLNRLKRDFGRGWDEVKSMIGTEKV